MERNSKIEDLATRLVDPNHHDNDDDDDQEALFAELEAEIENDSSSAVREHGLEFFKREAERMKDMKANQHGQYAEIMDEKEVIRATAREPRCVVHFYHTNFKRCEIMDRHLAKLAPKYFNTRFIRVFVENIPWLVEKLHIKVLPCVICFVDGVAKDRLVGFDDLGNSDTFNTAVLELRLSSAGVIQKTTGSFNQVFKVSSSRPENDGEDFDLDD